MIVMRIKVVVPVSTDKWNKIIHDQYESNKDPGTEIDIVNIKKGPESITSLYDGAWAELFAIKEAEKAEKAAPKKETKKAEPKIETKAKAKPETKVEEKTQDLSKMTVAQLKEMAKAKGITGISSMKKADLIAALS